MDLQQVSPPVPDRHYDVCVVGAGPAGITLALKLAERGKKVLLLEGGGTEYSDRSQALYACRETARNAWPATSRLRYLGGTSNHWSGRCRPFESSDFDAPYYGDMPGWPIEYAEIAPYLPEAMRILDIPETGFQAINPPLDSEHFVADAFASSSPTRFGVKYRAVLEHHDGIDLYVNANARELKEDRNGAIESVAARNYDGVDHVFRSARFVLAMGAIENARFLLNQTGRHADGIGNQTGMVGRCFMEHMNIKLGEFVLRDPRASGPFQYFTAEALVRKQHIGKANVTLGVIETIKSYGRTAAIKTFFKNLACDWSIADKVRFIADFDCPGTGVLGTLMEQVAGKHSRVSLTDEIDAVGLRKAQLHWDIADKDLRTIKTVAMELAKVFAESGLGVIRLEQDVLEGSPNLLISPHAHHMGTTRMAATPEFGVVDENCRVFGADNLYIAGSSLFATGGASNPTMPIIQFALRLADHLSA